MKREPMRGMRDIPTIQGLRHQSGPATREQAVTELARLEHERARLRRELTMWVSNQTKTEKRLHQVEERLAELQHLLKPQAEERQAERKGRRVPARQIEEGEGEGQAWREVELEY
jgi:TolA-binding protein